MVLATVYWHWAQVWLATGRDDAHWCGADAQRRLKGQFSLRHYRRTGFVLVALG